MLSYSRCSQFYLVLDVMNLTTYEVELHYTKSKLIQIEEGETCRIPIPIDRCPVSAFEQVPTYLFDSCLLVFIEIVRKKKKLYSTLFSFFSSIIPL